MHARLYAYRAVRVLTAYAHGELRTLPLGPTVPDLVEAQVARTPAAVAVEAGCRSLTYGGLDAAANRLARRLQALGVGPDAVVGVCLDRSIELAVALLGVLKAGGACLPLDPALPPPRLAFLAGDAKPAVLITSASRMRDLPAATAVLVVRPEDCDRGFASAPRRAVGPSSAAYVIYTSGSTGTPKGVVLTHGALVNHQRTAVSMYELGAGDRVLQFCSLSFDASIEELFPTWAAGAMAVFRPDDAPLLGGSWLDWLRQAGITVMNLPTGYWHAWTSDLAAQGARIPPALRLVVVGGEQARGSALRSWIGAGGEQARWINAYGPTEATCMATAWEVDLDRVAAGGDVEDPPIGLPLPNVQVRVVDAAGQLVVEGAAGELLLGGPGLARGYLNQPELTARRFVADPSGSDARWYRTGDLVSQDAHGVLTYLGRIDQQVKVRGYRVEVGEVEMALLAHPGVGRALVVAPADGPLGDRRLVAYVVPAGAGATVEALRAFLAQRLPSYLVPAAIVALDEFPLTPNGKVDRDALPPPARVASASPPQEAPRTPVEEALAAIFARVLGLDAGTVGVDDDFFALGGHSLLATQVIAVVRDELAPGIPLRAILEAPTVAGLAKTIEGLPGCPGPAAPLTAVPRCAGQTWPLGLAQRQMWRLEVAADPPGLYNVTAVLRLDEPVDEGALRQALAWLARRHEALRTRIEVVEDAPVQVVEDEPTVMFGVSTLCGPGDLRPTLLHLRLAEEDARPFPLDQAPLWRAHLVHVDETSSRLALTFDHLICDGTSAYIVMGEVHEAYAAFAEGREPVGAPLPVQPADFAVWQSRHATPARLDAQQGWWVRSLAGMPLGPVVPFDHLPAEPSRRIASRPVAISSSTRQRLTDVARSASATVFVVATAAVQAVLGRWAGVDDVVLSTTLSGRGRAELEGLVGMFSGIGRLRTDLSGDPPFAEVVRRARSFVLGMFENQDVPFMRVREAVAPDFPTAPGPVAAAVPVELQYFRTSRHARGPGDGVVHNPNGDHRQELFFRGQLHPLSLTLLDDGTELWGGFSYKLDYYEPATVDGLARALEATLAAVADDPWLRLSALPVPSGS